MKIAVIVEITFDQNALNSQSEVERMRGLNREEMQDEIAIALSGCEGIENLAGVEVKFLACLPLSGESVRSLNAAAC